MKSYVTFCSSGIDHAPSDRRISIAVRRNVFFWPHTRHLRLEVFMQRSQSVRPSPLFLHIRQEASHPHPYADYHCAFPICLGRSCVHSLTDAARHMRPDGRMFRQLSPAGMRSFFKGHSMSSKRYVYSIQHKTIQFPYSPCQTSTTQGLAPTNANVFAGSKYSHTLLARAVTLTMSHRTSTSLWS